MNSMHCFLMIVVMVAVTVALRFIPFVVFGGNRQTPAYIDYLGKVLPYAIMEITSLIVLRFVRQKAPDAHPAAQHPYMKYPHVQPP